MTEDGADVRRIPVVEERARIRTEVSETVGAHVRLDIDTHEAPVSETLRTETVSVERIPIDRIVLGAPEQRTEGSVTIIPVVEEVVIRAFRIIEEVRLTVEAETHEHSETVRLRRQTAIVTGGDDGTGEDFPASQKG